MYKKRECWHLTSERLDKLERMSDWQLDLLLLRAYWMKYQKIVRHGASAALVSVVWFAIQPLDWLEIIGGFLLGYYMFTITGMYKIISPR